MACIDWASNPKRARTTAGSEGGSSDSNATAASDSSPKQPQLPGAWGEEPCSEAGDVQSDRHLDVVWPRLVNGVSVPAPGSEEPLPELSPLDPDSEDPVTRDKRSRAQMLLDGNGDILDVGRTQRFFTSAQRRIIVARDMGCAFPDCMAPPQWTEAHHIIPWQKGGVTSVSNGVLCCSLHHHYLHDRGWTVRLKDGVAWFMPPYSEDITRTERRNNYHQNH